MSDPRALPTKTSTERWFVDRGVPHFIVDYRGAEDVLTRATPVLILIFLFSAISAIDLDWPAWGIVAASLGGLVLLLASWAVINRARGRRPLAPPDRIGRVEISVFVLVPSLLPLLFGGDLTGVLITAATMIALLGIVYAISSYALIALTFWSLRQIFKTLGQTVRLFARSLPLLLLGFMFLLINAEAWQSAGRIEQRLLLMVVILFAGLASLFLITQIPRETKGLNQFASWAEVDATADDAPVAHSTRGPNAAPAPPPLTLRERGNVFLVFFVSQGLRLLLVALLVGGLFVVLGLLLVQPDTIELWTVHPPDILARFTFWEVEMSITRELVQVAGFLAAFAGVYFSVYTTTDATLRADFFEDTVAEVRQNLAVRMLYREAVVPED